MKILTGAQIREADQYTIINEPIASLELMERAAERLTERILRLFPSQQKFVLLCGPGNNGGDGLAIARLLLQQGRKIEVYVTGFGLKFSEDCGINLNRLRNLGEEFIHTIRTEEDIPDFDSACLIIDALFGTGISRPLDGLMKTFIQRINSSNAFKISIDIPSGLMCEDNSANDPEAIVRASHTLTIELPKLSFFFADNARYTGSWEIVPIALHPGFISACPSDFDFVDPVLIRSLLRARPKFGHKGTFGHALIVAGSYGKMGAAVLSTRAALRAGSGLVTSFIPRCGYTILQSSAPEAMCITGEDENTVGGRITDMEKYSAIGVGPGIGVSAGTRQTLKSLIPEVKHSLVLDADALNILSEERTWMEFLPAGTILTPHPGEFDRLTQKHNSGFGRLETQRKLSSKFGVYIVLKGAFTSITSPDGRVFFNSTGNAGMATGGSGDVLTGIITGFLAQGYSPLEAAVCGVYLHGLSGDITANEKGEASLIASDLTENLGKAIIASQNG